MSVLYYFFQLLENIFISPHHGFYFLGKDKIISENKLHKTQGIFYEGHAIKIKISYITIKMAKI